MSPANLTVYLKVPFFFKFLILKVALPFELVFTVYFFLLTVKVIFFLARALPLEFLRVITTFLTFLDFLKVFLGAVILVLIGLTVMVAVVKAPL